MKRNEASHNNGNSMGISPHDSVKNQESNELSLFSRRRVVLLVVMIFLSGATVMNRQGSLIDVDGQGVKSKVSRNKPEKSCESVCQAIKKVQYQDRMSGLDRAEMKRLVLEGKTQLVSKLQIDYGDYFTRIFVNPVNGRSRGFTSSSDESVGRLKRKLQIKLLSALTTIDTQKSQNNGCLCVANDTSSGDSSTTRTFADYVWATGGHSAAAGHGNLFNESYTAFLGRDLKPIFEHVGIDFQVRNYAMGGTGTAGEISFCFEQVFGNDVDFLAWDSGMTDQDNLAIAHFGYRGMRSAGFPAMVGLHVSGRDRRFRESGLTRLAELGGSTFVMDEDEYVAMKKAIPESSGISSAEIEALPEFVRNFKCQGKIESGDPYCLSEKYNKQLCYPRAKLASWHPGFRAHAMDGHALALFFLDILVDALDDLIDHEELRNDVLLSNLTSEEHTLHERLRDTELPDWATEEMFLQKDLAREFWLGDSVCKTARLPAQSRYLGYTTDTSKVGPMAPLGHEKFDIGLPMEEAIKRTENNRMQLTYDPNPDEREVCEVLLKPDYKDFFVSHQKQGTQSLIFPNKKERKVYGYNPTRFHGLLVVWFGACDWGECEKGDLHPPDFVEGKFEMSVNNRNVKEMIDIGLHGWLLVGKSGRQWAPNEENGYEIKIRVTEADSYVRLMSVIVF